MTSTVHGVTKTVVDSDTVSELNSTINCTVGTIPAGLTCNFISVASLNAIDYRGEVDVNRNIKRW